LENKKNSNRPSNPKINIHYHNNLDHNNYREQSVAHVGPKAKEVGERKEKNLRRLSTLRGM
jgi:hypothetical protein